MRKKKMGLLPIVFLIALTAGITYAVVRFTVDVSMSFTVVGDYQLSVWEDVGLSNPLTSIDFGEHSRGDSGNTGIYYIENTGTDDAYLIYDLTGWPGDIDFWIEILDGGGSTVDVIYPNTWSSYRIMSGEVWNFNIHWDVDPGASEGVYSPTLSLHADDGF